MKIQTELPQTLWLVKVWDNHAQTPTYYVVLEQTLEQAELSAYRHAVDRADHNQISSASAEPLRHGEVYNLLATGGAPFRLVTLNAPELWL